MSSSSSSNQTPTSDGRAPLSKRVQVNSFIKAASETTIRSEARSSGQKGALKRHKRLALGREMSKDSASVVFKKESADPLVAEAKKESGHVKSEKKAARKAAKTGLPYKSETHELVYMPGPVRQSYSDVLTMRHANENAKRLTGTKVPVLADSKSIFVQTREVKVASSWPPLFKETGSLTEWTSRQVICTKSIQLKRSGARCHIIIGGEEIGSWAVLRPTHSDVLSNILSICLWGTEDVQAGLSVLTPDAYHEGVAYDMKVRASGVEASVIEAVDKYAGVSASRPRVVVYSNGRVLSNYDWSNDPASIGVVNGAGGWHFVCAVTQERGILKAFSTLFSDVEQSTSRAISNLGFGVSNKPVDYETNNFDYVKDHHHVTMKIMAGRAQHNMTLPELRLLPDDNQSQHASIETYLKAMGELTSSGNEYLEASGDFTAKMCSTPLFGYKAGYDPLRLFKPNASIFPPEFPEQAEGTTEQAVELLFKHVRKVVTDGRSEGATKAQINAAMAWSSVDAKAQYGKSTLVKREVNQEEVTSLIAKLIDLQENANELTREEIRSGSAAIHTKIEEEVLMSKELRVKRMRRLVMSAPVEIRGEACRFAEADIFKSSFLESAYNFLKRKKAREAEAADPDLYRATQKNLPYVADPVFDRYMERDPGPSIHPPTEVDKVIEEMGVVSKAKDGNYDLTFTLDKVDQEVGASMGHSTGTGVFIKSVPHTKCYVLQRNSGLQAILCLVVDSNVHTLHEKRWWVQMTGTHWYRSKFYTLNRAKAAVQLNGEERLRVLNFQRSIELADDTHLGPEELERSKRMFSNLITMIITTQKQPDSAVLSYSRYIGMILQNNCVNRGEVKALFTKIERIKTRFSLWVIKKFSAWVKSREDHAILSPENPSKTNWLYRCWMTGYKSVSSSSKLTMFYVGNVYEKTLGERVAAIRGPFDKLLVLAYDASDRKGIKGPDRINQICEELESYGRHFQVDWGFLRKVLDTSFADHKQKHPEWRSEFESTLAELTRKVDGAALATRRSSFWHVSDDLIDGHVTISRDSGRATDSFIKVPNWTETMQTMVVEYPNIMMGQPLTNFENLVHPMRAHVTPKKQLQTKREILIQTPAGRLSVASLEIVMRAFATGMDNEVLTNKNKEAKISAYASGLNYRKMALQKAGTSYRHVLSRSSADATKWCQLFRMPVFMVMVDVLFAGTHENLRKHCTAVLEEHVQKKIQIPASILREILSGSAFNEEGIRRLAREFAEDTHIHGVGECMVKIVDNMLQGILHYTSSVFHSLIQNYFTERAMEALREVLMTRALNFFMPVHRVEAEARLDSFNSRQARLEQMEKMLYDEGSTSEYISAEASRQRAEDSRTRTWLADHLMGESKKSGLVPSWEVSYQNAASSDDSSIAMDVILTGPSTFVQAAGDEVEHIMSKLMIAKRSFYQRLGIEESTSKSSVGNFIDVMEFNSKWYEGPVVIDVVIKQIMSALMAPPPTGFADMQNHYVNGRTAIISAGGSVELVQQVRNAQAVAHHKILGADMSDMYPLLMKDIEANPHFLLGKFEYEKNPALCGLLPSFLIHYQWLKDEAVNQTEQALYVVVEHDMDPSGVMALGIRVEVGNGLKSQESMLKSAKLLEKFQKTVLGDEDPREALEGHALSFLLNNASPSAKLLLELIRDTKRPIESDVATTSVYKLSTLLITSPCLTVTIPDQDNAKKAGFTIRMSLPALHDVVKVSRELLDKDNMAKPVRLTDRLEESSGYIDQLSGLRVTKGMSRGQSVANRAVSSTRQTLSGIPGDIDIATVLYKVWSGAQMDDVLTAQFETLQGMFPDIGDTIEETQVNMAAYAPSKMDVVQHFLKGTSLVHNIRSRSGTSLSGSAIEALIKVLTLQSFQGYTCKVTSVAEVTRPERGMGQFRYEANMRAIFPDNAQLTASFMAVSLASTTAESGSRDEKLLLWARKAINKRWDTKLLIRASQRRLTAISEGSKGRMTIVLGSAIVRLKLEQNAKSARVTSISCNCTRSTLTGVMRAYSPKTKKWLSWEPYEEDMPEHNLWYSPTQGASVERHEGMVPVFYMRHIEISPDYNEVQSTVKTYGATRVVRTRIGKSGRDWDFMDITLPAGIVTPSKQQQAATMSECFRKGISYKVVEAFCMGSNLTHQGLNSSFKASTKKWFWKWLVWRAIGLIQNGSLDNPSWEDYLRLKALGKDVLEIKTAQSSLIAWNPAGIGEDDPDYFESRRQRRLKLASSGMKEDEIEEVMDAPVEGPDVMFDYGDEDDMFTYVDYVEANAEDTVRFDMDFDGELKVEFLEMTESPAMRAGVDISAFARMLIVDFGGEAGPNDPFAAARYLKDPEEKEYEEPEEVN